MMNNLYFHINNHNNHDDGFNLHQLDEGISATSIEHTSSNELTSSSLFGVNTLSLHRPTNHVETSQSEIDYHDSFSSDVDCVYSIYCRE